MAAFRVSDSHTLTPRGEQAKYCVEHSLYVVYITPSRSAAHNLLIRGKDGREILASKSEVLKRYSPYEVKDSFFSVAREVHKIIQSKKSKSNHETAVENEVELLFQVSWKKHATLDQEWRHKLDVSRRCTAFPLPVE